MEAAPSDRAATFFRTHDFEKPILDKAVEPAGILDTVKSEISFGLRKNELTEIRDRRFPTSASLVTSPCSQWQLAAVLDSVPRPAFRHFPRVCQRKPRPGRLPGRHRQGGDNPYSRGHGDG